jgi:hypothetical protein
MDLVGRRGCDAARGDRCGADAADVDFRHRQVEQRSAALASSL